MLDGFWVIFEERFDLFGGQLRVGALVPKVRCLLTGQDMVKLSRRKGAFIDRLCFFLHVPLQRLLISFLFLLLV